LAKNPEKLRPQSPRPPARLTGLKPQHLKSGCRDSWHISQAKYFLAKWELGRRIKALANLNQKVESTVLAALGQTR